MRAWSTTVVAGHRYLERGYIEGNGETLKNFALGFRVSETKMFRHGLITGFRILPIYTNLERNGVSRAPSLQRPLSSDPPVGILRGGRFATGGLSTDLTTNNGQGNAN